MFNKVWLKISAAFTLIILMIMLLVFHFFTVQQIKRDRAQLEQNMERIAKQIASIRLAETEGWYVYQDWINNIMESEAGQDLIYIAIYNEERELVAFALNPSPLDINASYLTREEKKEIVNRLVRGQVARESWSDFDHIPVEIRWGSESLGKVDVGFSLIDFNNRVHNQLLLNLYLIIGSMIVGISLSILMGKRIVKPLNSLSDALLKVPEGQYNLKIKIRSKDEIGNLSRSFNYMISRMKEKAAIEDFTHDLVFTVDYEKLAQMVTERIVVNMSASQGALFLLHEQETRTWLITSWTAPKRLNDRIIIEIEDESKLECLSHRKPFKPYKLNATAYYDDICKKLDEKGLSFKISIIAPLISQGEPIGFLFLGPQKSGNHYDDYMLSFLQTLTQQAAMAIRNSALLIELKEQERYKRELEIARNVQERLLPDTMPDIAGLEFNAVCKPAYEVGGDYYDYFILDHQRIGIAIADVTGKGTSAAFYMAELKGMMTFLAQEIESPKELMCRMNAHLCENVDKRIFVTMIYGILNTVTGEFTFVRAGHNALVVKRSSPHNQMDVYIPPGIGLGLTNDVIFHEKTIEETIRINRNDILFLYTDGLSEAMNEHHQEYSEERLFDFLEKQVSPTVYNLQTEILNQVQIFTGHASQHDDITMVLAKLT